jgi:hypothetical protein
MAYASGQVSVGTTATSIFTTGPAPSNDAVLVYPSAAVYVGPSGVTTSTGFEVPATTPVYIPVTGAEELELYGIVSSGTATESYIFPS